MELLVFKLMEEMQYLCFYGLCYIFVLTLCYYCCFALLHCYLATQLISRKGAK